MSLGCTSTTDDKPCLDQKLVQKMVLLLVRGLLLQHQALQMVHHLVQLMALLLVLQRRNRNLFVKSLCPDMSWSGHILAFVFWFLSF